MRLFRLWQIKPQADACQMRGQRVARFDKEHVHHTGFDTREGQRFACRRGKRLLRPLSGINESQPHIDEKSIVTHPVPVSVLASVLALASQVGPACFVGLYCKVPLVCLLTYPPYLKTPVKPGFGVFSSPNNVVAF